LKRILLIGAAAAGLVTAGIPVAASAATTKSSNRNVTVHRARSQAKAASTKLKCTLSLTTVPPAGSSTVTPGDATGTQYGTTSCAGLQPGVTRTVFTTDASGDLTGKIQHWFQGGTIYGTFDLAPVPATGPPTTTTFSSAAYSGTVKLTSAAGLLKGTTATGTLSCTTTDSTHYTCTEDLSLTPPASPYVVR
jgi:hypothetical protein